VGEHRQPWEQLPDETARAYEAFLIYRDLGGTRTVDAVAARIRGGAAGAQPGRKRAAGRLFIMAKDNDWAERARAYDLHQALLKQQAADKVTVQRTRIWAEREGRQLEDDYRLGRRLVQQAATISEMPVVRQTVASDGVTTIYEPVDLKDIAAAAAIAEKGRAMAWDAINKGLGHENADAIERAKTEAAARPQGDVSAAQRNLEDWRARQRQHMLTFDPTRPPGEAPAPEPEPDPARRNGSGVPPVPASSA
jgi:hypothetical protein